ncbi:MAG TPA: extracellular solute-binding protein, partial [Candidatus Binatia bacterium]|nr:extracellular solute-binding protein [Candidatus Binatia bacterium]
MSSVSKVAALLSSWALCFSLSTVSVWSQTDDRAKLVEGAKKEGKLIWYTSTNVTESKPLLDDFEKQYPFIKGEIFRASGEKTLNRIITEARAGRSEFDIVTISEVDALIEAKLLTPYRSPEAKSFIPDFKDPNGYWTAIYINYASIGYNSKMLSEKEAPKQWEDLLEPKWKGKFAIDQEQYPWFGTLHKAWGRERAQKYMRALAKQDIQWRKGHTLIAQLMAAGEFPLGVIYAHRVEEMKQRGAPVEWVNTVNPIVVTVNAAGLSAKPQHPNAAKLFYDFVLSKPAQQRLRTLRRIPARPDIEPFSPRMEQSKLKLQVEPAQTGPQFNAT